MRIRSGRWMGALLAAAALAATAFGEGRLRIANWNVTNYSNGRVAEFQTAIYATFEGRSMAPDVLIVEEMLSQVGVNNFLAILNTAPGSPADWAAAPFVDGPDTDSALFYRTSRVALASDLSANGVTVVATGGGTPTQPRNIMRYDLRVVIGTGVEARLALYASHMKSGSTSDDHNRRLLEATRIRTNAQTLPPDWYFILGGDFNIPSAFESAYQQLVTSQANDAGRFFDPINTPGSWQNNPAFQFVHTQDPIGAGGMDDRFDILLVSQGLVDGQGLDYVGDPSIPYSTTTWDDPHHSYRSWGNDGTSFNLALTIAGNTMVGPAIAQALVSSAQGGGHLPVFLDLRVPPCLGDFACDTHIDAGDFGSLCDCLSGPAGGDTPAPSSTCLDYADFVADGAIDLADFAAFQAAFTG